MDKDDDYRREAADARELAGKAKNDKDRTKWLLIAQGWLNLIRRPHDGERSKDER